MSLKLTLKSHEYIVSPMLVTGIIYIYTGNKIQISPSFHYHHGDGYNDVICTADFTRRSISTYGAQVFGQRAWTNALITATDVRRRFNIS